MIEFALVIVAAIGIVAVASVIYWLFYRHRINKQLHDETPRTRRLLSPLAFTVITVLVVSIAYICVAAATLAVNKDSAAARSSQEYFEATYDFQDYSAHEMIGYRSLYSMDENPGYTKTAFKQGNIQFTCFIREDTPDFYHPSFIIYAQYLGNKNILYSGNMGYFFTPHDINMGGKGSAGGEYNDYICVLGTATKQSRFELTIYLYDSNKKSEDMGEYAVERETIAIQIP